MAGPLEERLPSWAKKAFVVIMAVAAIAAAGLSFALSRQERGGPAHIDLVIGDGIPATFFVPGKMQTAGFQLPDAPPEGRRPPVIVLAHGAAVDRSIMSPLARSFAHAGIAVLTFDFRGHGGNRNNFGGGELRDDFDQVVSWVAQSPYVDPDRIVVMGHSMGAFAAVEFASYDHRPAAVVALSGGVLFDFPHRPSNVLFASGRFESPVLHDHVRREASRLAGKTVELNRTYGDVDDGTGVRVTEIDRAEHVLVLYSSETVEVVVDWIDEVFGMEHRPAGLHDPRLLTAALYLPCAAVLMFGVGLVVAKLTPAAVPPSQPLGWPGVGIVAAAVGIPLLVPGRAPSGLLSSGGFDFVVGFLALAGVVLLGLVMLLDQRTPATEPKIWDVRPDWRELPRLAVPAAVGVGGAVMLLVPLSPLFHRVLPTPERVIVFGEVLLAVAPLFVVIQTLARRGGYIRAAATSVAMHAVILVAIGLGVALGVLGGFVGLAFMAASAAVFGVLEFYALATQGRASGFSIGVAEAVLYATMTMIVMPVG